MQKIILIALLVATNLGVFWSAKDHQYVWTDKDTVLQSQNEAKGSPIEKLASIWKKPFRESTFTPVVDSLWVVTSAVQATLFPGRKYVPDPKLAHSIQLILHCANAVLVFLILTQLITGSPFAGFLGALVFAIHPLQLESVVWSSAMPWVLGTFFGLWATALYLLWHKKKSVNVRNPKASRKLYYFATLAFVLSLLSNPAMSVIPAILFILVRFLPKKNSLMAARLPIWPLGVWVLASVPFLWLAIELQNTVAIETKIATWMTPLIAGDALAFYLLKLILPIQIGPDYGRTPSVVLNQWWGWATWLAPIFVFAAISWTSTKTRKWLLAGFAIFVISLMPFLGWVAFEAQAMSTVANRYAYLALLGPSLCVTWVIGYSRKALLPLSTVAVICGLGVLTRMQMAPWSSDEQLWKHALQIHPASPVAHSILAERARQNKDWDQAKKHYEEVLKSSQANPEVFYYLAEIERQMGNREKAATLYEKVLQLDSGNSSALRQLGYWKLDQDKTDDAIDLFEKALATHPKDSSLLHALGRSYYVAGNHQKAADLLTQALDLIPDTARTQKAEALSLLGLSLTKLGKEDMAQIHLERSLQINPELVATQLALGDIYFARDQHDLALPHYQKAAEKLSGKTHLHENLGQILLSKQKYKDASQHLLLAVELAPEKDSNRSKLGRTYFNLRQLNNAEKEFQRALQLNSKSVEALYYLGEIARWTGKLDVALSRYYQVLKIEKWHPQAHYRLGDYFMKKQRYYQALRHYQDAQKTLPEDAKVLSGISRAKRAIKAKRG